FEEHLRAFVALEGRDLSQLRVRCETDKTLSFIHVNRDSVTFTREELALQLGLLSERFGDALVRNPAEDSLDDESPEGTDEEIEHAIEAMRSQKRSLVGYREEKRVHVYFLNKRKAKAAARR
ncbi:MAG: hypothetical protein JO101_00025, partial [Candidatus Eremiobacteraeota bacterium]|nr:hypothetical protein [Candidatus Eremiobacteraeota bacterium]